MFTTNVRVTVLVCVKAQGVEDIKKNPLKHKSMKYELVLGRILQSDGW